jgi:hypothetical protein
MNDALMHMNDALVLVHMNDALVLMHMNDALVLMHTNDALVLMHTNDALVLMHMNDALVLMHMHMNDARGCRRRFVCEHFIASLMPPFRYTERTCVVGLGFSGKGQGQGAAACGRELRFQYMWHEVRERMPEGGGGDGGDSCFDQADASSSSSTEAMSAMSSWVSVMPWKIREMRLNTQAPGALVRRVCSAR